MFTGFEDVQKAGRENYEAVMKSFGTASQGFQAIAAEYADYSKKSFEDGVAAFEKLAGAGSLDKAIEVQSAYVKSSYDEFVEEVNKLGTMYSDLAKDLYKPYETFAGKSGK